MDLESGVTFPNVTSVKMEKNPLGKFYGWASAPGFQVQNDSRNTSDIRKSQLSKTVLTENTLSTSDGKAAS